MSADCESKPGLPSRQPVPLRQAFAWDCPECQQHNYVDGECVEFDDEEERRAAYIHTGMIEEWEETPPADAGQFLMAPSVVQCSRCRRKYPASDDGVVTHVDGGDDDDED